MITPLSDQRIEFQAAFPCFVFNRCVLTGDRLFVIIGQEGECMLFFPGDQEPWAWLRRGDVNKLAGREVI